MKTAKLLTVSLVAVMTVAAARADIASTDYVDQEVGTRVPTTQVVTDKTAYTSGSTSEIPVVAVTEEIAAKVTEPKLQGVEQNLGELQTNVTELTAQFDGFNDSIPPRINTLETNFTNLTSTVNEHTVTLSGDENTPGLVEQFETLQEATGSLTPELVQQITTNQSNITTAQAEIQALEDTGVTEAKIDQIGTHQQALYGADGTGGLLGTGGTIAVLNETIGEHGSQITANTVHLIGVDGQSGLVKSVADNTTAIAANADDITELGESKLDASVYTAFTADTGEFGQLQVKVSGNSNNITTLQTNLGTLQSTVENNAGVVSSTATQLGSLQSNYETFISAQGDFGQLETSVQNTQTALGPLNDITVPEIPAECANGKCALVSNGSSFEWELISRGTISGNDQSTQN